jgi:hypothetical protein
MAGAQCDTMAQSGRASEAKRVCALSERLVLNRHMQPFLALRGIVRANPIPVNLHVKVPTYRTCYGSEQ